MHLGAEGLRAILKLQIRKGAAASLWVRKVGGSSSSWPLASMSVLFEKRRLRGPFLVSRTGDKG